MGDSDPMQNVFYLYVPDADTIYQQAVAAGAKSLYPPADQQYGDRVGAVEDAWGHTWYIATSLK
jgi:PhnB protein